MKVKRVRMIWFLGLIPLGLIAAAFAYPPSQKTMCVSPWMNAQGGPAEARRAPGLRSRSGCFGGFRQRNEGYPGRQPGEASFQARLCRSLHHGLQDPYLKMLLELGGSPGGKAF